jgi:predicted nucleic acid-binding protein
MKSKSILVDASAVLAVILEEPEKASIIRATAGYEAKAPGCLRWEVGNAFSAMAKRGRLGSEETLAALQVFEIIPLQEVEVDLEEALNLALRNDIYAYDAYYLAAAKKHRVELLSLDHRMVEVARNEGIKIKEIK